MNKYLYFTIEHKNRELDSKILLAMEAAKKGYVVIIGTKRLMHLMPKFMFPKGVYFYKEAMAGRESLFREIQAKGHKVVVHDEEGFVQFNWDNYKTGGYISYDTLKYVDKFLCWGNEQFKVLKDIKKENNLNVFVSSTGHPRLDLLKKDVRAYNKEENKFNKKIILINTKFGVGNYNTGGDNYLVKQFNDDPLMSVENKNLLKRLADYDVRLLKEYEHLIDKLVVCFPNELIVIRPHPVENMEFWENRYSKFDNIFITREKPVGYWLQQADVVLHTGCPTAIESFLVDTPVIAYKPIHEPEFDIELPNDVSFKVQTIDECVHKIGEVLDERYDKDIYKRSGQEILSGHLENIDQKLSTVSIIDELDNLIEKKHPYGIMTRLWIKSGFKFLDIGLKAKGIIRKMINSQVYVEEKGMIEGAEVKETVNRFKSAMNDSTEYEILTIVENVVLISAENIQ